MKGEYNLEEKALARNMFAKMRHTQKSQPQSQSHHHQLPLHHHHNLHHPFQLQTSDDSNPQSPSPSTATPSAAAREPNSSDGATIEVVRRPRGRPPGSKNKPKPPIIITREPEPAMNPYVLEIAGGVDLVDAINRFCRNRNTGICILSASGAVANVTIRQPSTTPAATATATFHGRFDLLSLSATVLPPSIKPAASYFSVSLAGPQGQIVGGTVVGPLFAAATVYVVAASFNNPSFHRLSPEEEDDKGQSPAAVHGGGDGGHPPAAAAESCGMSFYGSGHLGSDVIWAPTARQPPPPPPHY